MQSPRRDEASPSAGGRRSDVCDRFRPYTGLLHLPVRLGGR